jgi:hypothetical protein
MNLSSSCPFPFWKDELVLGKLFDRVAILMWDFATVLASGELRHYVSSTKRPPAYCGWLVPAQRPDIRVIGGERRIYHLFGLRLCYAELVLGRSFW